jgi:hypothetical protein
MAFPTRLVLRGARFALTGAIGGAVLGLVTFLPGELVATADLPGGATFSWPLAWGVAWACGRVGAVVGVIFFLIRRTLMGEVADPRLTVTDELRAAAMEASNTRAADSRGEGTEVTASGLPHG